MSEEGLGAEVTTTSMLRQRASVLAAEVDGETVLLDEASGAVHVLNPSATVIWRYLEGPGSPGALARELAAAFGIDVRRVERDVLQVMRSFHEAHLTEVVPAGSDGTPAATP